MKVLTSAILLSSLLSATTYAQSVNEQGGIKVPDEIAENTVETLLEESNAETVQDVLNQLDEELPESVSTALNSTDQVETFYSGGRLERVSIKRENGVEEVYRNHHDTAIWSGPEKNLGDEPNVRRWVIGSW